jgi:hypothetical protein
MQMLAERLVKVGLVEEISDDTETDAQKGGCKTVAEEAVAHPEGWPRGSTTGGADCILRCGSPFTPSALRYPSLRHVNDWR